MKYLSICSGIEAATVAWHHLGWKPWAFAEVDAFPSAVLAHHYPEVPNLGDITQWETWSDGSIDLLVGGTPCQSFSVAGKRGGMDDARGQLALAFSAIAGRYKPRYVVWENVPGVLSSGGGRDFGAFVQSLVELGYGVCWRVLDAQYVRTQRHPGAVPQRRRRVFLVGHLGSWQRAAAVLFVEQSLQRHPASRGKARQKAAGAVAHGPTTGRKPAWVKCDSCDDYYCTIHNAHTADCDCPPIEDWIVDPYGMQGRGPAYDVVNKPIVLMDQGGSVINTLQDGTVGTLRREMHGHEPCVLAFAQNQLGEVRASDVFNTINTNSNASGRNTPLLAFPANLSATQHASTENLAPSMGAKNPTAVANGMQVRRLTPRECERLQGFPDDYTLVPHRGKPAADGPRYKALGNSMAVNCMEWIGERIAAVDAIAAEEYTPADIITDGATV